MKIKRLPSGHYNALVFSHTDENGKRHYKSITSYSKPEVMRLAAAFKESRQSPASQLDLTIGECVERYIKSKENVLSPNTIRGYRQYQKNIEPIKNIKLSKFSTEQFQGFIGTIATDHRYKTVKNIYSLIIAAIKMFSDKRYKITLPPRDVVEYYLPSENDVKDLMRIADDEMKMCIALASIGTLRRGEICGLKQKDVDREHNTVYVHGDMIYKRPGWAYKETPKTSSSVRIVILPESVIDMIPPGEPNDFICKRSPTDVSDDFIDLRNRLGLKCRFHDLRHYAASVMHAIGVPDQYIMERGGWKNDGILKAVYRNTLAAKTAEFTALANDYFSQSLMNSES